MRSLYMSVTYMLPAQVERHSARAVEAAGGWRCGRAGDGEEEITALVEDLITEVTEVTNPDVVIRVDGDVASAVLELTVARAAVAVAGGDAVEVHEERAVAAARSDPR